VQRIPTVIYIQISDEINEVDDVKDYTRTAYEEKNLLKYKVKCFQEFTPTSHC